jgi:hypothetical protein
MGVRVIVDENSGPGQPIWEQFQRQFANRTFDFLFLKDQHIGIPDVEILEKVLRPEMILLTDDCVLHMQALKRGFQSYTADCHGNLTNGRLKGVKIEDLPASAYKELLSDYRHQPKNDMAARLTIGFTDKQFKKYRVVRRRIRSHFGSAAAIYQLSVTIGEKLTQKGLLCGFVLNIAGNTGVPGLRASEGYCLPLGDQTAPEYCVIHALRDLYLLQLEQVRTELFVTSPGALERCTHALAADLSASPSTLALKGLIDGIDKCKFTACTKGRFFDGMQQKLDQLSRGRKNEVTTVDFDQIITSLLSDQSDNLSEDSFPTTV